MKQSEARELVKNVRSIMKTLKLSLEKACEAVETTVGDYMEARQLVPERKEANGTSVCRMICMV